MPRNSVSRPPLVLGLLLVAGAIGTVASPTPAASSPADHFADTPYLPLFTQVRDCNENRAVNELTGDAQQETLASLSRWYVHANAQGPNFFSLGTGCKGQSDTTLASKLAGQGMLVTNYRNGSYVSQAEAGQVNFGEAADLEATSPLAMATFWPPRAARNGGGDSEAARLAEPLDPAATVVLVTSAADHRPDGLPGTWPYVASRGTGATPGAHSANTRDFASWIRIGDELMQVLETPTEDDGIVRLTVHRGLWGSVPAEHAAGDQVMSPVYIGSTGAASEDGVYSGSPVRDDPRYALRYAIKIWQPDGQAWLAGRVRTVMGEDLMGYNGLWLDSSSCAQYNQGDAYGHQVVAWDDPHEAPMDTDVWGSYQRAKLDAFRAALPGVAMVANNFTAPTSCSDTLLAAADGGVLENWLKQGASTTTWPDAMAQSLRIQTNDWPALYWARWDRTTSPEPYRRFTYGSLLLTMDPESRRAQYGGPFGMGRPHDLFFWDWGTPSVSATAIDDLKVTGTPLYRRDFDHGIVVVNPSGGTQTYPLETTYWDVSRAGPDSLGPPVETVTIAPRDAVFLLRTDEPAPTTTSEPTTTSSSTTSSSTTTTTMPPTTTSSTTTSSTTTTTTAPPTTTTTLGADTTPPRSTIVVPTNGQTFRHGPVTFSGTATDDRGVASVGVAIKNRSTGKWWQAEGRWGAEWELIPATVATPGAKSTTWRFVWSPPSGAGKYRVTVVAKDTAGNTQPPPRPGADFRVRR